MAFNIVLSHRPTEFRAIDSRSICAHLFQQSYCNLRGEWRGTNAKYGRLPLLGLRNLTRLQHPDCVRYG